MRYLLALLFSVSCITGTQAQPGFGPEVGIGISTMRFAPQLGFTAATYKSIPSAKIGGLIDASLNGRFYVQGGLSFSRRGQERAFSFHASDSLNAYVAQTITLNYIDVPLAMLYKTGRQGRGRIILGAGVMPSYILGGRNKQHQHGADTGKQFNNTTDESVTATKPVALFDFGLHFFAGYELPTGLFIRAYYYSALQDIGRGTEIDKNRMFGLSAGYIFGKGRNINKETADLIDKGTD